MKSPPDLILYRLIQDNLSKDLELLNARFSGEHLTEIERSLLKSAISNITTAISRIGALNKSLGKK